MDSEQNASAASAVAAQAGDPAGDLKSIFSAMIARSRAKKAAEAILKNRAKEKKAKVLTDERLIRIESKGHPPHVSSADIVKSWKDDIRWRDVAIVAVTTITTCKTCHSQATSFAPQLMLSRWHPTYGRHLTPVLEHEDRNYYLPRRLETVELTAHYCPSCFVSSSDVRPLGFPNLSLELWGEHVFPGTVIIDGQVHVTTYMAPSKLNGEFIETKPKVATVPIRRPQPSVPHDNGIPASMWPLTLYTGESQSC